MLTYLQDIDRLSVYVVCNFALSLSLFYLSLYVLLCDMLVAYGPLSLINHHQSIMYPLKVDLLSVTFDSETVEIRLLIVTHPSAAITLQLS